MAPRLASAEPVIPRSENVLPFGEAIVDRLSLDQVEPSEILAGAENQFHFFFPGGLNSNIGSRTQLDSLLAATILLEHGLRRGGGSYQHARTLFYCYYIMYQTGRSGIIRQSFNLLLEEAERQSAAQELQILRLYTDSLDLFEEHGYNSAKRLGEVLNAVRPEESEIAYALARLSELRGDYQEAARWYQRGLHGEMTARRLLAMAEMQAAAGQSNTSTIEMATLFDADLQDQLEAMERRIELRSQMADLEDRARRGRIRNNQRLQLATLYRRAGRVFEALSLFEELSDWDGAPPEYIEEYAIALMEANLPTRMRTLMEGTRERSNPSSRLLQLRIVAESLHLVTAVASSPDGFRLEGYLESEQGRQINADLSAFAAIDNARAQFVRVYLQLVATLVELRLTGSVDSQLLSALGGRIEELIEQQPGNVAGHRFRLMHSLYSQEQRALRTALEGYQQYCSRNDCEAEYRRIAALVYLQQAARENDTGLLAPLNTLLDRWPSQSRGPVYYLAKGSADLLHAQLDRQSEAARSRLLETARATFLEGLATQPRVGRSEGATASDYAALYNNLAYISLERRDPVGAALFLSAARRFAPTHPVILLNTGVSYALRRSFTDAFVTIGLAAGEAMVDPALTFQVLRWAGHIYNVAGRSNEASAAFRQAMMLYEGGGDWVATVDDGLFPGGPVEWGLLYADELEGGDSGLEVTLDLAMPPIFFVPAPVGILEMSATNADD